MNWLRNLWLKYMCGAKANNLPVMRVGLFGRKLKHPSTLEEATTALDYFFSAEVKKYADEWSESKFTTRLHDNIGRSLRNDWELWNQSKLSKWFNQVGIDHPDDMSGIILTSYYRKRHNLPIQLTDQIQEYTKYWQALKDDGIYDNNK